MEKISNNPFEDKGRARIDRQEARRKQDNRLIRTLLVALFIIEPIVFVKLASASNQSHGTDNIRPTNSITLNLKESELRALKGNPVKKTEAIENKSKIENLNKKVNQKNYEWFMEEYKSILTDKNEMQIYKDAEAKTGTDRKIIMAFDDRECNLSPNHSTMSGELIGEENPDSHVTYGTKLESAIAAGNHIRYMAKLVYGIEMQSGMELSDKDLIKVSVAFNRGDIYKEAGADPELSPYGTNEGGKVWPIIKGEPLAGRRDDNLGVIQIRNILEKAEAKGII